MPTDERIEYLYGPLDGDVWPEEIPYPELAVLMGTTLRASNGLPLLARYLPAAREADIGSLFIIRRALIFDGWYLDAKGDQYGPRTGGLKF